MQIFKRAVPYLVAGLSLATLLPMAACRPSGDVKPTEEINPYRHRLTTAVIINTVDGKQTVRDKCDGIRLPVNEATEEYLIGGTIYELSGWSSVNGGTPLHMEFQAYRPGAGKDQDTDNVGVYSGDNVGPEDLPENFRDPSYSDGLNMILGRITGICGGGSEDFVPVTEVAAGTTAKITIVSEK